MATLPASVGFYSDGNVRIVAHTALIQGTVTPSVFHGVQVKLPTAANTGPIVCVTELNFFEPNYFSYAKGTDPTTVTATTPTLYTLTGKAIAGIISGLTYCIAAGVLAAGDVVLAADIYGRVNNMANLGFGAGTLVYPVGIVQHATTAANQLVETSLYFAPIQF